MSRRFVVPSLLVLSLVMTPTSLTAQSKATPDSWSLSASVQGDRHVAPAGASGGVVVFYVTNTGTARNRVLLSCRGTDGVICDGLDVKRLNLKHGMTKRVVATITVGAGSGTVTLNAEGTYGSSAVAESPITVVTGTVGGRGVTAAASCGVECGGGGPTYGVDVGNPSPVMKPANSGPHTTYFTVYNSGSTSNTYVFSCSTLGGVTCNSVTPSTMALASLDDNVVAVTYSVGSTNGTLRLKATGFQATDIGSMAVTASNAPPLVSLAPHNSRYHDVTKCLASCFGAVWSHSTPAYFSMDAARSLTLVYNSSTVEPTPVVFADVSTPAGFSPSTYSLQAKLVSSGTFLTFLNGATVAYYTASGTTINRVAVAFDAQANGLATGWHDIDLIVTGNYSSGGPASTTVTTRVLVVDETNSAFGSGVMLAGLQRLYFQTGSYSVAVTEGDGSIAYYNRTGPSAPFQTPGGTALSLEQVGGVYRRMGLDSSYVEFSGLGRMTKAVDRFGNTTTFSWDAQSDTLLTSIQDPMGKTITLAYTGGTLNTVTDPGSPARVTSYTIDGNHNLTRITDPDTKYTQYGYSDAAGHLSTTTSRGGRTTTHTFHSQLNRVKELKGPSFVDYLGASVQPTVTFTPQEIQIWQPTVGGTSAGTAKGAIAASTVEASIQDPLGATSHFNLDVFGAPTLVTDVLGEQTTLSRDSMSRATYVVKPGGHVAWFTFGNGTQPELNYSKYLLKSAADLTTGRTVDFTYTGRNDVDSISGDVVTQKFTYWLGSPSGQPAGVLTQVQLGDSAVVVGTYSYDTMGRLTGWYDAAVQLTRYYYDPVWGNLTRVVDPLSNETLYSFDAYGRTDTLTLPEIGPSVTSYGVMNQVLQTTDPAGLVTTTAYDADFLVDSITDPKSQVYHFSYNAAGMPLATHDLGNPTLADSVWYDAGGNVRKARRKGGQVVQMTYDAAGQLLSRSAAGVATDYYRYATDGSWTVAENTVGYDSLAFDPAGRLSKSFQVVNGTTYEWNYTYDVHDRLTSRTDGSGGHARSLYYNSTTEKLDSVCTAGVCARYAYDENGRVNSTLYKQGVSSLVNSIGRDVRGAVTSLTYNSPQINSAFSRTFSRDSLGRPFQRTYQGTTQSFAYDSTGRLTNACDWVGTSCRNEFGATAAAYIYDDTGNRLRPGELMANIGAGNRVNYTHGWYFTHDTNGNVIEKCSGATYCYFGQQYTWDALGRLTELRDGPGALVASYQYDALGRRVSKTLAGGAVERYVYDDADIVFDLDGSGTIQREYGFAPGSDNLFLLKSGSTVGVALHDPNNGTVEGLVGFGDVVIKDYSGLQPWGAMAADTGLAVRYRFAGRELDGESGLYYMRARYYDPETGRFLTEDPIGIAGGLNLYAYVGNDPINRRDPSGTHGPCLTWTEWRDGQFETVTDCPTFESPDPTSPYADCLIMSSGFTCSDPASEYDLYGDDGRLSNLAVPASDSCFGETRQFVRSFVFDASGVGLLKGLARFRGGLRLLRQANTFAVSGDALWSATFYGPASRIYQSTGINLLNSGTTTMVGGAVGLTTFSQNAVVASFSNEPKWVRYYRGSLSIPVLGSGLRFGRVIQACVTGTPIVN